MKYIQSKDTVQYYVILALSLINFYFFFWDKYSNYTTIFQTIIFILALSKERENRKKTFLFISFFTSFLLLEYIAIFFSIYLPNSFHHLTRVVFVFCFVFTTSKSIKYLNIHKSIVFFTNIIVVLLGIQTILGYLLFKEFSKVNGFLDVLSIKFLFNVNEIPVNVWFTVVLSLLPFPILGLIHSKNKLLKRFYLLTFGVVLTGVFISFSRGIYLSLFFYALLVLALLWYYKPKRNNADIQKFILITAIFCATIISVNYKNVINTIDIFHASESQNRSIEGRLETWESLPILAKDFFVLGVGSNNYSIHYNGFNPNQSLYSLAPSSLVQILIEKGVLGAGVYVFFFICFIVIIDKKVRIKNSSNHLIQAIVFLGILGTILVRELSFASFFWNNGVLAVLSMLFILTFNNMESLYVPEKYTKKHQVIKFLLMGLLILISIKSIKLAFAQTNIDKGIEMYGNCAIEKSKKIMQKALEYDCNNAYYHYLLAEATITPDDCTNHRITHNFSNIEHLSLSVPDIDPALLNEAMGVYEKIIKINKFDDEAYHNLGWIYFVLNETEKAINFFNKAITIHPKNAMYHVSLGLAIESGGSKKTALEHYKEAIFLGPFILDSPFFIDLCDRYPSDSKRLINDLIIEFENENDLYDDPFVKAKLSKLYMYEGKIIQADTLLKEVTKMLPNLKKPWQNLSEIALLKERDAFERYNKKAGFLNRSNYIIYYQRAGFSDKKLSQSFYENYQQSLFYWTQSILYSNTKAARLYRTPPINHCNNIIMRCFVAYSNPMLPVKDIATQLGKYYEDNNNDQGTAHYYYELSKYKLSRLNHKNALKAHF